MTTEIEVDMLIPCPAPGCDEQAGVHVVGATPVLVWESFSTVMDGQRFAWDDGDKEHGEILDMVQVECPAKHVFKCPAESIPGLAF